MELSEVILQGVRGQDGQARGVVRWAFPAGVAVVPASSDNTLCARAAYELLAGVTDGELPKAAANDTARAAIILVGRDQRRYRLVWELQSGKRTLQVMNGDKLEVVSTMQAEIAQALSAQVGFPQQDTLREVFFSFVDDLPSRRLSTTTASTKKSAKSDKPLPPGFGDDAPIGKDADKPLPPGFGDAAPSTSRFASMPEAELRARLAEIKQRTDSTVDVQALEFELDGLQKKTFELQGRKQPLNAVDNDIATVDGQLARFGYLDGYPSDFLERAQGMEALQREHEQKLVRLDSETKVLVESVDHLSEEVSGVTRRGGASPIDAAKNDPLVRWGVVGGVAAIVIGVVGGAAVEALRYVALLDIPAFGVAVYGGIKLLSGLEEGASTRMKILRIQGERKNAVDRFEIDKEQIARLLEKNQLTFAQLPELIQDFIVCADLKARRSTLMQERAQITANGIDIDALDRELEDNASRIKDLEQQLQDAGAHYDPEIAELSREADEIERVLRGELKAASTETAAETEAAEPVVAAAADTKEATSDTPRGVDVAMLLIRQASDLLVQNVDAAATALAPRAGQMMQALTNKRCTAMALSSSGVDITTASGVVPYAALPPADRDMVAFAIRLALVEATTKSFGRLPLVFDRSFDGAPAELAPVLVRALQFIGGQTQVMLFTAQRELAGAGTIVQGARVDGSPAGAGAAS